MTTSDDRAIRNLLFEYAERLDGGDLTGMAQLFEHASFGFENVPDPVVYHGAQELLDNFSSYIAIYENGTPRTKHVITNVAITFRGDDRAEVRSYLIVFQQCDDFPLQAIVGGRYHDEVEKVDGTWRFAKRVFFLDLAGDNSHHTPTVAIED